MSKNIKESYIGIKENIFWFQISINDVEWMHVTDSTRYFSCIVTGSEKISRILMKEMLFKEWQRRDIITFVRGKFVLAEDEKKALRH